MIIIRYYIMLLYHDTTPWIPF